MMQDIKPEILAGEELLRGLPHVAEFALIGSAMYLPAEECSDVDFAVMLKDGTDAMQYLSYLISEREDGWTHCGEEYDTQHGTWGAVRLGNLNLMVTHNRAFFDGYKRAMEVCKVLNLKRKEQRIAVCKVVRDGMSAQDVFDTYIGGVTTWQ